MSRIGLLGGTFNPIHKGHIAMAKAAMEGMLLDEVWLLPSGTPPHKEILDDISSYDRFQMCELAVSQEEHLVVKDFEQYCLLPNFSYKTLAYLHKTYEQHQFFFIIGDDSLRYFHEWVHPEWIVKYADIVVINRNALEKDAPSGSISNDFDLQSVLEIQKKRVPGQYTIVDMDPVDISSSEIRARLLQGEETDWLNPDVVQYIREHRLYQKKETIDMRPIMEDIKRNVKASRYLHILGVMDTAANLAMRYSYPVEVARLAGLLHDCTKHMNAEDQLQYCKEHGLSVTEGEKKAPQLLHSKTGAVFAKENYGIQDPEILHAIEVHTTGCREMSLLDKIVFIADYIEPSRDKAPRLKEIRAVSYVDLDLAMAMILSDTINYLKNNHKSMDSGTLETYDYYKDVLTRRGQDLTLL